MRAPMFLLSVVAAAFAGAAATWFAVVGDWPARIAPYGHDQWRTAAVVAALTATILTLYALARARGGPGPARAAVLASLPLPIGLAAYKAAYPLLPYAALWAAAWTVAVLALLAAIAWLIVVVRLVSHAPVRVRREAG